MTRWSLKTYMNTLVAIKDHPGIDTAALAVALEEQGAAIYDAWKLWLPVKVVRYKSRKRFGADRIQFYDELPAGEGGVHLNTRSGSPYAKVLASEGTLAASHEFCEMLVDPLGDRFQTVGTRDYLVEICDPVERLSYIASNGVELSDFITPAWYGGAGEPDVLSQCNQLSLTPGGYVSWIEGGDWFQSFADESGQITTRNLGRATLRTRREKDELAAGRPAASTPPKATGGTAAPLGGAA